MLTPICGIVIPAIKVVMKAGEPLYLIDPPALFYFFWSYPVLDAVAELVKRESAVGKTAVCGLNSGSVNPIISCIKERIWNSATAPLW